MEKRKENNTEYEELSIQRKASKRVDGKICGTLCGRRNSVKECGEVKAIDLYEDLSSSEH